MNPFEAGRRKVIPAVLIYVKHGDSLLMLHRIAPDGGERAGDYHAGKWNGLGGKAELDESPLETARRELREESGLDLPVERFKPIGTLQFPNFKSHKAEDWLVFVFVAEVTAAEVARDLKSCEEGALHWIPMKEVLSLKLWAGDREFIPYVLSEKPFLGTIWYEGQEVRRSWIMPL